MRWALLLLAGCDAVLHLEPVKGPPGMQWAGIFVSQISLDKTSMTFSGHAHATGDAVVLQLGCHAYPNPIQAISVSIATDPPTWDWQPLEALTGMNSLGAAAYGAIAPDNALATVTVTWGGITSPCSEKQSAIGDVFTFEGKHPLAFDTHNVATGGTGDCVGSVMTQSDGAAIWAACNQSGKVIGVDPAYEMGADDGHGNFTSHRLTADPRGTVEMVDMPAKPALNFVLDLVTIVPQ